MQHGVYTAFEMGWGTFPWIAIVSPLVFFAIGLLLIIKIKLPKFRLAMGGVIAFQLFIFILGPLLTLIPKYVSLYHTYKSSESLTVVGVVENFTLAPKLGAQVESFRVGNVEFSYNKLDDSPCLHTSHIRGGLIENGLLVRIYYNDDCIQRVDVLPHPAQN